MIGVRQQFKTRDPGNMDVEMLVTIWEDGTATIAYRDLLDSESWGPPHPMKTIEEAPAAELEEVSHRWRAISADDRGIRPTWSSDIFTEAQVRQNLARYYGADWALEVQTTTTTVSAWRRLG